MYIYATLMGLLWELNELFHVKCVDQFCPIVSAQKDSSCYN